MSRASEAAHSAYPKDEGKVYSTAFGTFEFDRNAAERKGFQLGYERAEKATIERAESHLESVLLNFLDVDTIKWIIKDFKKAMEDEK